MIIEGRAVVVSGNDVNTDVLYPGPYLNIDDPDRMKDFLFEGLDPSLRDLLGGPTVLIVGRNFGGGSSREHVPLAMKAWGIGAVIGRSFARIFFRNCINLGLPAVVCPDAVGAAQPDSAVRITADEGRVEVDGRVFSAPVLPPFLIDMVRRGGLVPYVRTRLAENAQNEKSKMNNEQ
jgi:3-isopropylmalate/(R)-2-methylmalate dehydratase small subunit